MADQEEHWFTYSLYPHKGNLRECDTVRESYCLNFPALTALHTAMGETASLLSVDQKNVMAETVKPAEDGNGVILRVYEYENARTKAAITFGMGHKIASVQECNLMEEPEGGLLEHTEESFAFVIKPYEIKTYRVVFQ